MKHIFPILFILFTSCFLFEDEQDQNTNLTLSLHSAGVTTVNLNVNPEDSLAQFTFELTRDDSTVQTLSVLSDTIIKDTGLNPNTSYIYKGYWLNGTKRIGESDTLHITTMDTTSHNFTWEIDTLGEYGSYLNDVAIIDENNIWVVGKIVMPDPDTSFNGTGEELFNAAHWNGNEWELILIDDYRSPFDAVFVINENEIWFSSGCFIYFYDGETFDKKWECDYETYGGGHVNRIWGSSSTNLFFCGIYGKIVHYDGNEFQYMESGSSEHLIDIWGVIDDRDVEHVVWSEGFSESNGSVLLRLDPDGWKIVYEILPPPPAYTVPNKISWVLKSIWTDNPDSIYCASAGRIYHVPKYYENYATENYWYYYAPGEPINSAPYTNRIRGNARNDIFVAGALFNIHHYNGKSWKSFDDLMIDGNYFSTFLSADVKDDYIVAVGYQKEDMFNRRAIIAIGYR